MVLLMPRLFPLGQPEAENRVICVSAGGTKVEFSALMSSALPSLHMVDIEGSQCFPLYLYDEAPSPTNPQGDLLASKTHPNSGPRRREAIGDKSLDVFRSAYGADSITKEDIFHYVYGILHSEDYRSRFADNLSKQLPRIPILEKAADFWSFVEAGRRLGDLHVGFESVAPYPVIFTRGDTSLAPPQDPVSFYRVEEMKFAGKRPNLDKSTLIYNGNITMSGIPLEAYDYVVNGKPALE